MRMLQAAGDELADDDLESAYAYPTERASSWLRLVFVASLDGATADASGQAAGLSSPADQRVFALMRGLADVVLVGAGTARAEQYAPVRPVEVDGEMRARLGLAPLPPIAVVSRTLDAPPSLLTEPADESGRTIVVTTAAAPADRRRAVAAHADVVVCGDEHVDPVSVREELGSRGLLRIQAEGGPRLSRELAAAGVLDEVCLTVSPQLRAGDSARFVAGERLDPAIRLQLVHALVADDDLLLRYVREGA